MCMLLYVKLIQCNGFPEIYAWLKGGTSAFGIYAFFYMWSLYGVVVFQRSMLSWRRGWGQSAMDICGCFYMCNLFGVVVFQISMLSWRRVRGYVCLWYICILLYVKLMCIFAFFFMWNLCGVVVFQRSLLDWRRRWGQSAMGICAFCYLWKLFSIVVLHRYMLNWRRGVGSICHGYMCIQLSMTVIWCSGFPEIYARLEEGGEVTLPLVYVHSAIYDSYLVYWFSRDLCSIGGGGEVNLPWVYVHSAICDSYLV